MRSGPGVASASFAGAIDPEAETLLTGLLAPAGSANEALAAAAARLPQGNGLSADPALLMARQGLSAGTRCSTGNVRPASAAWLRPAALTSGLPVACSLSKGSIGLDFAASLATDLQPSLAFLATAGEAASAMTLLRLAVLPSSALSRLGEGCAVLSPLDALEGLPGPFVGHDPSICLACTRGMHSLRGSRGGSWLTLLSSTLILTLCSGLCGACMAEAWQFQACCLILSSLTGDACCVQSLLINAWRVSFRPSCWS